MTVANLWRVEDGKLVLPFHYGQTQGWDSLRRFVFILAGTQSGKTSYLPWWLWREAKQTCSPDGGNDYIATTANYDLFKLKFLPEMRTVFEYVLKVGRYWSGERLIELRPNLDRDAPFWAKHADDPMWGRIILRSAASPAGLESATAKAAILDEAGQDEFTLETWEAVLRRLSLHQGRVCAATTLYNLGWIKGEIYDAWKNGDPDIDVIQFASIQNPAFPKAEFERARNKMQDWRFAMFYLGQFARPAGLIYSAFKDDWLVDPFDIPDDWERIIGVDFGGANTARLWLAQDPGSEIWYAYKESLEGDKSSQEYVEDTIGQTSGTYTVVGGAASETQYRMDWQAAGLDVLEPPIKEVENGIDKVIELMKANRFRVFRTLHGLRDELGSYRRKLDERGEPTEEILNKRTYHRLDALRYSCCYINQPIAEITSVMLGNW